MIPTDFALGLGSGLALALVLFLVLRWLGRRPASPSTPPRVAPNGAAVPADDPPPASLVEPPPAVAELPTPSVSLDAPPESPRPDEGARPTVAPVRSKVVGPAAPPDRLRLSQRIILHVASQGTLLPGDVAPRALCQAGIGEALGVPQAGLAAVLRRLEAADVLVGERGHVRGQDRRLKVYRLTSRGRELATELRRRGPPKSRPD